MSEPAILLCVHHPLTAKQRKQRMHALGMAEATAKMTVGIDMSRVRRWPSLRKPRTPSTRTLVKRAEAATGKTVTAITTLADGGTKLDVGTGTAAAPENPWPLDEFRTKETKQ
jgi:hypothetical protein